MWAGKRLAMMCLLGSICLLPAVPPVWCNSARVSLRSAVEVDHSPVLLSDLLPADVGVLIRQTSASIVLCQAPQPGSIRLLETDEILHSVAAHPELLRALSIPSRVTIGSSSGQIRQESIREAIVDYVRVHAWAELPETARLEWPDSLAARAEHAQLQVASVAWDTRRQAPQFRLGCRQRSACGDFWVHVVVPASVADAWQQHLVSPNSVQLTSAVNSAPSGPVLAQKGKPATLVLQSGGMRVSLPVICAEPGALNQRIRVFDVHSQRVFYADVVGEGLLHASL